MIKVPLNRFFASMMDFAASRENCVLLVYVYVFCLLVLLVKLSVLAE